jgi:hypothetical protein
MPVCLLLIAFFMGRRFTGPILRAVAVLIVLLASSRTQLACSKRRKLTELTRSKLYLVSWQK